MSVLTSAEKIGFLGNSSGGMSAKQAELLNYSYNRACHSLKIFNVGYEELTQTGTIIDGVASDFISHQLIKSQLQHIDIPRYDFDPKIKKEYYEKIFSEDFSYLLKFAQTEGLSGDNLKRLIKDTIAITFSQIATTKEKGYSLSHKSSDTKKTGEEKIIEIAEEVKRFGLSNVDVFYKKYPALKERLDKIESSEGLILLEAKFRKELKATTENQFVLKLLLSKIAQKKAPAHAPSKDRRKLKRESEDEKITEYRLLLEEALDYLKYNSDNDVTKMGEAVENLFKFMADSRDRAANAPIIKKFLATCMSRTDLFWQLRTGRKIIYPEKYGETRQSVKKYEKSIPDRKLLSESGSWWFTKKGERMENYANHPAEALVNSIQTLLEIPANMRHGGKKVNIMVIINDNRVAKIIIDENAQRADVIKAIKNATIQDEHLTPEKKYRLKTEAYKADGQSQEYKDFYSHQAPKTIFGQEIPFLKSQVKGDYIIRLITKNSKTVEDINSPLSLFLADPNNHKLLVNLDFSGGGKYGTVSFKYNHHFFEAGKQRALFLKFFADFKKRSGDFSEENSLFNLPAIDQIPALDMPAEQIRYGSLPILEAVETDEAVPFEKIILEKGKTEIGQNIVRLIVTALTNNIPDFYGLRKGPENSETEGTPYDPISPVLVTTNPFIEKFERFKKAYLGGNIDAFNFSPLEVKEMTEYIKRLNLAIARSDQGKSYHAVIAAPTGRADIEEIIYLVSKPLLSTPKMLKESGMMSSDLVDTAKKEEVDGIQFITAQSDTNNGGAIGYIFSQTATDKEAIVTCRMSPRHIKRTINGFISNQTGQLFFGDKLFAQKYKTTVNLFNDLLIAWENLTTGKINLSDYQKKLNNTYKDLLDEEVCGKKNLQANNIDSPENLQRRLNQMLRDTAKKTIDKKAIEEEKEIFTAFIGKMRESWTNNL